MKPRVPRIGRQSILKFGNLGAERLNSDFK